MSHDLDIAKDGKVSMGYAGETPWHGLGTKVADCLTPAEILKAANLDWTVEKIPMQMIDGSSVPSHYALRRSSDSKILGICGKSFLPTQNDMAFKFFDDFVKAGSMKMDTAGAIDHGRRVWGLASIQKSFKLAGGDEVNGYMLLSNPHIWGRSITTAFTPIRVVCNNTLTQAMQGISAKTEGVFRLRHTQVFNEELHETAKIALGVATDQLKVFEEQARHLSKKTFTDESKVLYVSELFHKGADLGADELGRNAQQVLEAIETQPGAGMKSSKGTYWGLFNAVTYVTDHKLGRTDDSRLTSAWFGPNANLKSKALNLAIQHADKYGKAA